MFQLLNSIRNKLLLITGSGTTLLLLSSLYAIKTLPALYLWRSSLSSPLPSLSTM